MRKEVSYFDDFNGPNRYAFLSNFYVGTPIVLTLRTGTYRYMTGEHLYQAWKAATIEDHNRVQSATGPDDAKYIGKTMPIRYDWEEIKYDVMRVTLNAKFRLDRPEGKMLLNTRHLLLTEGTDWGDTVWGTRRTKSHRKHWTGRNWLGTLLMARRAELQVQQMGAAPVRMQDIIDYIEPVI